MGNVTTPPWVIEQLKHSPVRAARKRFFKDLTSFAGESGTSYSVAYFTELGCYSSIPDILIRSLEKKGMDTTRLHSDYFKFQKERRRLFGQNFLLPKKPVIDFLLAQNPKPSLVTVIKNALEMSRAELSKGLCVQTASLYRLESEKLTELPEEIHYALVHCGISSETVKDWNGREIRRRNS